MVLGLWAFVRLDFNAQVQRWMRNAQRVTERYYTPNGFEETCFLPFPLGVDSE
jgi:hypothetical protein